MPRPTAAALAALAAALAAAPPAQAKSANDPSFLLLNRGETPVVALFATPAGRDTWGRDRLGGRPIPPRGSVAIRPRADGNCVFDIRAVFADRREEVRRSLDVCRLDEVAVGMGAGAAGGEAVKTGPNDPSFRLVNRGKATIAELYATPSGIDRWGRNRLGEGGVPAGTAEVVRIPAQDGCVFDLRVVLQGGRALIKRHDDLCRISEVPVP